MNVNDIVVFLYVLSLNLECIFEDVFYRIRGVFVFVVYDVNYRFLIDGVYVSVLCGNVFI